MKINKLIALLKKRKNPRNIAGTARFGINPKNTLGSARLWPVFFS